MENLIVGAIAICGGCLSVSPTLDVFASRSLLSVFTSSSTSCFRLGGDARVEEDIGAFVGGQQERPDSEDHLPQDNTT
eukprot:m.261967 g.261967  ORF g.261967 m.261967 type:complete len:78 (+) comp43925_c0_seq1:430-663(+)